MKSIQNKSAASKSIARCSKLFLEAADRGRKGQAAEKVLETKTDLNECKFWPYESQGKRVKEFCCLSPNERFSCVSGGPRPPSTAKIISTFLVYMVICFPPVPDLLYKREYSRMRVDFQEKFKKKLRKPACLLKILLGGAIYSFL